MAGGRCREWTGTGNWKREDIFLSTHAAVLAYLGEQASSAAHIQDLESSQWFARLPLHVRAQQIIPETNYLIQNQPLTVFTAASLV